MNNKKGVTMIILAISLAIMLTLATSTVLIGNGYVNEAKLDTFKTNMSAVSDNVNAYVLKNSKLPISDSNVQSVIYTEYGEDFKNEVIAKNDVKNKLYVVDINKLDNNVLNSLEVGKGQLSNNNDVFLVAENSNNVYYLKGFKYRGKMYYSN